MVCSPHPPLSLPGSRVLVFLSPLFLLAPLGGPGLVAASARSFSACVFCPVGFVVGSLCPCRLPALPAGFRAAFSGCAPSSVDLSWCP